MAGPIKLQPPAGGSSERTWYEPDLADLMTGATLEKGASMTVTSPWAFVGNNAQATATSSATDDGLREGYGARATVAKTDELWAALGTTADRILDGADIFEIWIIPRIYSGNRGIVHVGLADSGAFTSAMFGVAGGYRGSATSPNLLISAQSDTGDNIGDSSNFLADDAVLVSIVNGSNGSLCTAEAVDVGTGKPVGTSTVGDTNAGATRRLVFSLGCNATTGNPYIADCDVWFAIRDAQWNTGLS